MIKERNSFLLNSMLSAVMICSATHPLYSEEAKQQAKKETYASLLGPSEAYAMTTAPPELRDAKEPSLLFNKKEFLAIINKKAPAENEYSEQDIRSKWEDTLGVDIFMPYYFFEEKKEEFEEKYLTFSKDAAGKEETQKRSKLMDLLDFRIRKIKTKFRGGEKVEAKAKMKSIGNWERELDIEEDDGNMKGVLTFKIKF